MSSSKNYLSFSGDKSMKKFIFITMKNPYSTQENVSLTEVMDERETTGYSLVVWNDEVNTFDWVIETLVEVCGHSTSQAEQCALIIHTKGKYAVRNGSYSQLKPQRDAITDRQINATLEQTV
jgi:ATP-dependent Clp protease adaptor protein ClpS